MPRLSELTGSAPKLKLSDLTSAQAQTSASQSEPPPIVVTAPADTSHEDRASAITSAAGSLPGGVGDIALAGEMLRNYLNAHMAPDSTVRKVANAGLENGVDAATALAHHLGNIPIGAGQLATHAAAAVGDAMSQPATNADNAAQGEPRRTGIAGALDNARDSLDAYAKEREQAYQSGIPTNVGSIAGATLGELGPWVAGLGAARAVGAIPQATSTLGKLGTLAAEGGTMAAAQPVTGDGSYAGQKTLQTVLGAATGPVLYGAGSLAKGVKGVVQHITDPQAVADANIAKLFGASPDTIENLRNAATYVPGETPTAAQVLATPEAVQAERMLRNNPASGPAFVHAENANNAARMGVVQQLAGDDAAMEAAKQARRDAVQPFVDQYLTDSRPIVRWTRARNAVKAVLDNPSRMPASDFDALQQAKNIAAKVRGGSMQEDDAIQALQELGDSVSTKKAQDAFAAMNEAINKNMVDPSGVLRAIATIRNGPLGVDPRRGADLDSIMASINRAKNINGLVGTDMLDQVRQQAARLLGDSSGQSSLAYGPARDEIAHAIEQVAPGYLDYLATYAKHSEPINTMESVQKLLDPNAPGSLNAVGDPQLAISRLRQVLRGDDRARYPMSDTARQQLDNVRESLLRRTISDNKIAASGPGTAADLTAQSRLSAQSGLPSWIFGPSLGARGGVLPRVLGGATGAALGSHFGPLGAVIGSGLLGGLGDALGAANARVIGRVGSTAADANATAEAMQRYLQAQQVKPSPLLQLLFGDQAALMAPAATSNIGRTNP